MATILESLKSVSGYPVPLRTLTDVAVRRGLSLGDTATVDVQESASYQLAKADVLMWVSFAPNVQQGSISYDLLYSDRAQLRGNANRIYGELGDDSFIPETGTKFGYRGDRL
jgi:hypothetical protein